MNIERFDAHSVLHLDRDLVYNHFSDILNTVGALVKETQSLIVLNLGQVEYVSAKGIDLLLNLAAKIRGAGKEIKLAGLSPQLRRLFENTGIARVIEIVRDENEPTAFDIDGVSEIERNMIRDFF